LESVILIELLIFFQNRVAEENNVSIKVVDSLKSKAYSLLTEIDTSMKGITNQELEMTVEQLQAVRDNLKDRPSYTNVLPPHKKTNVQGRPASTKRQGSQFETVDAMVKKKAKLLSKM
jgi:hypothetical protein